MPTPTREHGQSARTIFASRVLPTGALLAALLVLGLVGTSCVQAGKPGAYAGAAVTNQEIVAAAQFAIAAQAKALQKDAPTARLELVTIQRAEQQVVAGMNYRLRLKVRHDGAEKEAEAVVWWQAWNRDEPYQLTDWTWR
jgi:uncharacterized cupredoxin-like copper-binding protein